MLTISFSGGGQPKKRRAFFFGSNAHGKFSHCGLPKEGTKPFALHTSVLADFVFAPYPPEKSVYQHPNKKARQDESATTQTYF
jgi:hypothetical protein